MWEPRHLTALWASTACYSNTFTPLFFLPFYRDNFTYIKSEEIVHDREMYTAFWVAKCRGSSKTTTNVSEKYIASSFRVQE
jgi:hypothetical protein